ncbi:hypothetical protein [Nakamurella sp. PAMC28650]|uniref:hypothetical protein n=1 Tax=Nakamurella sp. PAMC28650 TaxID=2762325 RepID=UPI00164D8593|nr:hypothetical protein [Nakamurella sp. PAMC28650]QNK80413.1 hypothetical protein H7F38_19860 [Nakamurella sp. PAMC28650]
MAFTSPSGREAVNRSWENTSNRTARTAHARFGLTARFARIADPDGVLPAEELAAKVKGLRRAHFAKLGRKSAEARREREAKAASDAAALAAILGAPSVDATAAAAVAALVDAS